MAIRIGTASWAAKSLVDSGRFYPPEVRTAEARLRYYSTQFPLVEVDSSYYAMPTAMQSRAWAARTPADFVFNVKAFRLFTGHAARLGMLPADLRDEVRDELRDDRRDSPAGADNVYYRDLQPGVRFELWQRFAAAVEPLDSEGKLGAVHFQFAPWVQNTRDGRAHVAHCAEMLAGHTIAAEFRHRSWFDSAECSRATLDFQRKLGMAHTVVDCPQGFTNTVRAVWQVTNEKLAVVRLHGRNESTWAPKPGTASGQRFNYDYDDAELAAMVPGIEALARQASSVHVVFNNNHDSQGQRNARALARLMGLAG